MVSKTVLSGFLILLPVISNGKNLKLHGKPSIRVDKKTIKPDIWSEKLITGGDAVTPSLGKKFKWGKRGLHRSGIRSELGEEFALGEHDVSRFVDEEIYDNRRLESDVMEGDFEKQEEEEGHEHVKNVETENNEVSNKKSSNTNKKGGKIINRMSSLLKKKLSDKDDMKDSKTTDDSESLKTNLTEKSKQYYEKDEGINEDSHSVKNSEGYSAQPEAEDKESINEPKLNKGFGRRFLSEENEQKRLSDQQNYIKEAVLGAHKGFAKKINEEKVPEKALLDYGMGALKDHKNGKIKEAMIKNVENLRKRLDDKAKSFEGVLRGRMEEYDDSAEQRSKGKMSSKYDVRNDKADELYAKELSYTGKITDKTDA